MTMLIASGKIQKHPMGRSTKDVSCQYCKIVYTRTISHLDAFTLHTSIHGSLHTLIWAPLSDKVDKKKCNGSTKVDLSIWFPFTDSPLSRIVYMLGGEMMSLYEKFFRDNTSVANKWLLEAEH